MRIGVYLIGAWYSVITHHYVEAWHARPDLRGVLDLLRWHLHTTTGTPLDDTTITVARYFHAADLELSAQFRRVLDSAGLTVHNLARLGIQGKEGTHVDLALTAWDDTAKGHLDAAALIAGHADLAPLASRLTDAGLHVVVPSATGYAQSNGGRTRPFQTSAALTGAATTAPDLEGLLTQGTRPGYPLAWPFIGTPTRGVALEGDVHRGREGVVNRWFPDKRRGFLTDPTGRSWFIDESDLPEGVSALTPGTRVSFVGTPEPGPGWQYPHAHAIQIPD